MNDFDFEEEVYDANELESDEDVCNDEEINTLFTKFPCITEEHITSKYILHVAATQQSCRIVALSSSDNRIEIYRLSEDRLAKESSLHDHLDTVTDLKFSEQNENILYTGSHDGLIRLWDLRTPKETCLKFTDITDTSEPKGKKFNCFDISSNGILLSAGSDLFEGESFLLFWDVRNTKLLGAFWESHTDDITQVIFHPSDPNQLISGSTDGLINIYDLTQTTEDDALVDTLNTESSVEQLSFEKHNAKDVLSCVTHTANVQLWNIDGVQPFCDFQRSDISKELQRKSENYTYIANTHSTNNNMFILAGSNVKDGECVRGLDVQNKSLKPSFCLTDNKQRVRCSWFDRNTNLLLTGGEKGWLNVWRRKTDNY